MHLQRSSLLGLISGAFKINQQKRACVALALFAGFGGQRRLQRLQVLQMP
jgi:hypothetical protein